MCGIYKFPFMLTVLDFNSDNRMDETDPIVLPSSFKEVYIDFNFFMALITLLKSSCDNQAKMKIVQILARIPAVRKNVTDIKDQLDKYIEFCMRSVEVIMSVNFEEDTDLCLDELMDLILRMFRVYNLEELGMYVSVFSTFMSCVSKLIEGVFSRNYKIGSPRAEAVNDILMHFLSQAVRKSDDQLTSFVVNTLKSYIAVFFIDDRAGSVLDEETADHSDIKELKSAVSASFKIFEEAYHYFEDVKTLVKVDLSQRFLTEFSDFAASPDFINGHAKLQLMLGKFCNFLYIVTTCFLSFMNVNADSEGGFTSLVMFAFGSSERSLHVQAEGRIMGLLLSAVQKIEDLFITEQLELFIDVVSTLMSSLK